MNSIAIHLNKKTRALSAEYPVERTILHVLLGILAVLLFAYLYFVSASVLNVMERREAAQRTATLEAEIGALEQRYYTLSQNVTKAEAVTLGLVPLSDTGYVYRPGDVGVVDIESNAI